MSENKEINLKNSRFSFEVGTLITKVKVVKNNENEELNEYDIYKKLFSQQLNQEEILSALEDNSIIIDLNSINAVIDLKTEDICMLIVSGRELEIKESYEKISELWMAWKSHKLRKK